MTHPGSAGSERRYVAEPFFLDTPHGAIFCMYRRPAPGQLVRGNVLCVPAFNEEMNRCRSMLTLLAESLAGAGVGMLSVDLFGTGDSAGEHGDARWSTWLEDIAAASRWLDAQPGGCTAYLGVRLGGALATQALADAPERTNALLLWQPVIDGKQHFTQFLRVKIAAQMDRPQLPKETTGSMRAQLAAGQPVEVAGYEIHPELARAIDDVSAQRLMPRPGTRVLWLEQPPAGTAELGATSAATLARWQSAGLGCDWRSFDGPTFWQQYERTLAPQAIEATVGWLCPQEVAA